MMIPLIDVILLIILAGFVFYGVFFGLIRTLGNFIGIVIGIILASRVYLPVADLFDWLFFGYDNLGKVLVFIILLSLINRLVSLVFYFLDKFFNIFSLIPGLKLLNKIGGGAIGFAAGSLAIGAVLYIISRYAFLDTFMGKWLVGSQVTPFFLAWIKMLLPFLPTMLKTLKALI